jgi:hypothetical protein
MAVMASFQGTELICEAIVDDGFITLGQLNRFVRAQTG